MLTISRRRFFGVTALGSIAPLSVGVVASRATSATRWIEGGLSDNFPSQDYESVQSAVGLSHRDIDGVRALVTARPALARATWDWGFGDWETALGAASHTGQREIAELLIAHGARPDIFTFAMLGQIDVVRAYCTANPGIQKIHGPHGITLLQHAVNGGDEAKGVVAYLEEIGDADNAIEDLPLDEVAAKAFTGEYETETDPKLRIAIAQHERLKCLTLTPGKGSMRFLHHRGNNEFSPRGAPQVRIVFELTDGTAKNFTIRDGAMTVASRRQA